MKKKTLRVLLIVALIFAIIFAVFAVFSERERRFQKLLANSLEDNAKMAQTLRRYGSYKNAAQLAEYYQHLADRDYSAAGRSFAQHLSSDVGIFFGKNDIGYRILRNTTSADEILTALRDGCLAYPENRLCHSFTDDGGHRIWQLKDRPYQVMESLPTQCYSMLGFDDETALIAACGGSPAGKLLILYTVKGEPWGANLVAMANLGERFWPSSLSEVSYILKVAYDMPDWKDAHERHQGATSLYWRTSTYDVTLLSAVDGEALFHRSITGIPPEQVEVWKDSSNSKTFEPEWADLKEVLNQALDPTGARITIRDDA